MKYIKTVIFAILCAFAGTANTAQAETITKTYLFSGSPSGATYQGYFYEEGKPNAHYICYPKPWTINSTGNIHATLADGITINIASSTNQIFVQSVSILGVAGDFTVTVGGGTNNYYIWHVELYNSPNQTSINEYNWGADVESTHTFSKTISADYFYKLVVTYSTEDIYLIDESTTTISGVDDEYPYTGSAVTPDPVVVCNGRTLTNDTHYVVNYRDNNAPGTAGVNVSGIPPYHGGIWKYYNIIDPATVPLEWTAGSTVEVTEDYGAVNPISVTGTGNVTLRITSGVTLTVQYGITIADGATLTVEGPGSLIITNNTMGETGNDDIGSLGGIGGIGGTGGTGGTGVPGISGSFIVNAGTVSVTGGIGGTGGTGGKGGKGGKGGTGISGSLVVNGGTVCVTGGNGGDGGDGVYVGNGGKGGDGGNGGNGGTGISGSLVVNGGTVCVTGGYGGYGGNGGNGVDGSKGSYGNALDCTVTCTAATHVIQESSNNSTWSNLASGSTSDKQYVRVIPLTPLTLYDNASNTAAIAEAAADGMPYSVTLQGRTLYKDGSWNTLCLPFNMNASQVTSQLAPSALMTLSTSSFTNGELTLNFADATTIQAGKPYIIKWAATTPNYVENPVFTGVTIKSGTTDAQTDYVDFIGSYSPVTFTGGDRSVLYLGSNNNLYFPAADRTMGACRAYFRLNLNAASEVKAFVLNFNEDDADGINSLTPDPSPRTGEEWYTLDGRKLNEKPSKGGIYIHNGRKEVLK